MEFVTVFDIAQSGYAAWDELAAPAILTLVGLGMLVLWTGPRAERWAPFSWAYVLFSLPMTVFVGWVSYSEYATLTDARRTGSFEIVEGPVENFDPMPVEGHRDEVFSVKGVEFRYSDFRMTSAFNNTAAYGGPVRRGAYTRVSYIRNGNKIIRLEMRASDIPSAVQRRNFRP